MHEKDDTTLLEKAKSLFEADSKYCQMREDGLNVNDLECLKTLIEVAEEAFRWKNSIEMNLATNNRLSLQIEDEDIRKTIDKVRNEEKFVSVHAYETFYEFLQQHNNKDSNATRLDDLDFESLNSDKLIDDFHVWFSITRYYASKLRVGPLISSQNLPDELLRYFDEIREAFAFGLDKACIALCRATIEICLVKELLKIDDYKDKLTKLRNKRRRQDFSLYENIKFADHYKLFDDTLRAAADNVRITANECLHFLSKQSTVSGSSLKVIRNTVKVVEYFYSQRNTSFGITSSAISNQEPAMNIHTDVTNFLKKQAPKGVAFSDQDNLLTKGVIDSLKMLDLINFMQEQFGIAIDEDEMMPDNFESVSAIVAFVSAKQNAAA